MFTADMLKKASSSTKALLGVLTSEEAFERAKRTETIVSIGSNKDNVFFFADDHVFGCSVLPKDYVPSTMSFPIYDEPRPAAPTGWIATIDQWIEVFEKDAKQLKTIDELVELLNNRFGMQ